LSYSHAYDPRQHHDYHDNLYCLLLGHKRFVLFPPDCGYDLYPDFDIAEIHPNGVIEYERSYASRPDGLIQKDAVEFNVSALEQAVEIATGEEKAQLEQRLRDALDLLMHYLVHHPREHDDFEELGLGIKGEDELLNDTNSKDDEDGDHDIDDTNHGQQNTASAQEITDDFYSDLSDNEDPSPFSSIPAGLLHDHFGLPTTAVVPPDMSDLSLAKLDVPFVVDLNPGEMLYLPASWWHEVTSSSPESSNNHVHMAFNYWFYPPDGLQKFEEPYKDEILWGYLRRRSKAAEITPSGKRSRSESVSDPPSTSKKPKQ
jgi:Cupin-like domain